MTTRVLIAGDSLSAEPYAHPETGTSVLLRAMLGAGYEVVSIGIGGTTLSTVREIAKAGGAGKARDFIIVRGGANDVNVGYTAASMETLWTYTLSDIVGYCGNPPVGLVTIAPSAQFTAPQNVERHAANAWLRANHATKIIDADAALKDPDDEDVLNPLYLIDAEPADVIHPNTDGNRVTAALMYAWILAQ